MSQLEESEIRKKEMLARKLAEEALAAKEQMLAIVSHDIKNPLFAIRLEAQMLLRAAERSGKSILGEEVKIQANRIIKTTDKMKSLISDLLDKNRSENSLSNLRCEEVDAVKLLNEAIEASRPLMAEKDIVLKLKVLEKLMTYLDRHKMFQVFSNLINNAIKFTPRNGEIDIELNEFEEKLIFQLKDSGPGLNLQHKEKIFEKYWMGETNQSGTGLGLFICKTIIEAHDGRIVAESGLDGGACFWFSMPKRKTEQKFNYVRQDISSELSKKIYIIDDDEDLREVMAWALGKEGYAVHCFKSPLEALHTLKSGGSHPQLIIVDYHMDEMKGSEFIIKKNQIESLKDCPILMISASPQEAIKDISPNLYKKIITKPIDLIGLVDNVKQYLL